MTETWCIMHRGYAGLFGQYFPDIYIFKYYDLELELLECDFELNKFLKECRLIKDTLNWGPFVHIIWKIHSDARILCIL